MSRFAGAPFAAEPNSGLAPGIIDPDAFDRFVLDERIRPRFLVELTAVRLSEGYLGRPVSDPYGGAAYGAIPGGGIALYESQYLFADGKWIGAPNDTRRPNRAADARIIASADLERQMPISPDAERRGEVTVGEIELANPDGALDDLVANHTVAGREVAVYLGPARGKSADFRVVAQVLGRGFETDLNVVRVRVQTTQALLSSSLHQRTYTGGGGFDGDPELAGRRAPVCFGDCFNITPLLVNKDQWIYAVHDGPIEAIDALKERGLTLIWNGVNAASYGELRATAVAGGYFATCRALGLVKAGFGVSGPAGPVTVDVRGDKAGGAYVNDIGNILRRAALIRARLDPSLIDEISLANLPSGVMGYYADGSADLSVSGLFNALLRSINGWYGTRRDRTLRVGFIVPPERYQPHRTFTAREALSLERLMVDQPPRYQQAVVWGKNWTPLAESDVSLALPLETRLRLQGAGYILRKQSPEVRTRDQTSIDGGTLETYFIDSVGASEVLDRLMALFRESRRSYRLRLARSGYLADLQTIVQVKHPREALTNGRNFVVTGVRDDGRRAQVELTLWG